MNRVESDLVRPYFKLSSKNLYLLRLIRHNLSYLRPPHALRTLPCTLEGDIISLRSVKQTTKA